MPRLAAALAALALLAAPAAAQLPLAPCTEPGRPPGALCGTLEVWEDREAARGRRIPLSVVVVPARDGNPGREALAYLAGGPGQAATPLASWIASLFPRAGRTRDVLVVDRRGTGDSGRLECNLYGHPDSLAAQAGAFQPVEAVRRCRTALEAKADLRLYGTTAAAADLEEVRSALGYGRLDLYGTSYGTRAAQEYLRRYPERVRSVVLQGSIPPDQPMPLRFAADAQGSLDGVVAECRARPECAAAFPRLAEEAREVTARLARAPVPAPALRPLSGEETTVPLTRDLFGEAVRFLLYSPHTAALAPAILHAAAGGDYRPLAEFALYGRRGIVLGISQGLYLSVTCAEDLPFVDVAEGERLAEGTFLGAYRVRDQAAACREWPRGRIPPDFRAPVVSDVPVLLVSGERDPVTPPANAEAVARTLRNARHVVVPSGGHGYAGLAGVECVYGVMDAFVVAGSAAGLDVGCLERVRRTSFALRLPPMRPVRVAAEALAPLVGRYAAADGAESVVELVEGKLRLRQPGDLERVLVPVGEDLFRIAGVPGGFVAFERAQRRGARMRMETWGAVTGVRERR